ncbi:RNA polymerase sigma factor [Corynebacterium nuruki]|uniref:RNA polymerase sigma factor n=1 Tax=Corynebacterium nuruki TaxID=1032851 RepID=UPI0039BFCA52
MNSGQTSDDHLLTRIAAGDDRALELLYDRYAAVVFSFVLVRSPDRGVAEEVCADTWLGCWRSARAFRHDSRVLTWLLGIAKRQLYVHTRRRTLLQVPLEEEHDVPTTVDGPAELVAEADSVRDILAALDALPPDLVEVVQLAWIHELPYAEIARAADIPVGTVKSRVSRARRTLRDSLKKTKEQ